MKRFWDYTKAELDFIALGHKYQRIQKQYLFRKAQFHFAAASPLFTLEQENAILAECALLYRDLLDLDEIRTVATVAPIFNQRFKNMICS